MRSPFFLQSENYNSHEATRRRVTASRCGPALFPPSCPALLLVPSPPSECVSVTQTRCEAEGPSGGAAAAAASTSNTSRAARSDLPRALRRRTTKRAPRLSLSSSALGSAANFPRAAWPAGVEGGGRTLGCLLALLAYAHFSPPRSESRGRAGIAATSNCPVSAAAARHGRDGGGANQGCGQGGRATSSAVAGGGRQALPARLRAPALEAAGNGVCGSRIPRPRRRKRLCQEPARRALPLHPEAQRAAAKSEPRAPRGAACCGRGAPRGRGGSGKWKRNKGGGGLFFCLCESANFFLLPYVTQTSKLVILFIVVIIVIFSACLSHFLSSLDRRAFRNTN